MGAINLAWIIPSFIVAGMLLAAIEWGQREVRAAARDVFPDSPEHRRDLAAVEDRTAPVFSDWPDLPAAEQAAWDEQAITAEAARTAPARLRLVKGDGP